MGVEEEVPVADPEAEPLATALEGTEDAVVMTVPSEVVVLTSVVSLVEDPVVIEAEAEVVVEELSELPVTLNCWDWARIPVFMVESESRLIW